LLFESGIVFNTFHTHDQSEREKERDKYNNIPMKQWLEEGRAKMPGLWKNLYIKMGEFRVDDNKEKEKQEVRDWMPEKVEVFIWDYHYAPDDPPLEWPSDWPNIESPPPLAIPRKSGWSLYIDKSQADAVRELEEKRREKQAVLISGKKWAISSRYPLPGEKFWMRSDEDVNAASDEEKNVPILVLVEKNPWIFVIGSDAASFVLYKDGTLIFNDGKKALQTKFQSYEEVLKRLAHSSDPSVNDFHDFWKKFCELDESYTIGFGTDQPSSTIHYWYYEKDDSGKMIRKKKEVCINGNLKYLKEK